MIHAKSLGRGLQRTLTPGVLSMQSPSWEHLRAELCVLGTSCHPLKLQPCWPQHCGRSVECNRYWGTVSIFRTSWCSWVLWADRSRPVARMSGGTVSISISPGTQKMTRGLKKNKLTRERQEEQALQEHLQRRRFWKGHNYCRRVNYPEKELLAVNECRQDAPMILICPFSQEPHFGSSMRNWAFLPWNQCAAEVGRLWL